MEAVAFPPRRSLIGVIPLLAFVPLSFPPPFRGCFSSTPFPLFFFPPQRHFFGERIPPLPQRAAPVFCFPAPDRIHFPGFLFVIAPFIPWCRRLGSPFSSPGIFFVALPSSGSSSPSRAPYLNSSFSSLFPVSRFFSSLPIRFQIVVFPFYFFFLLSSFSSPPPPPCSPCSKCQRGTLPGVRGYFCRTLY